MSKNIPPKRVKFLLCDDVRLEASGKYSLQGLYPDDKILVQANPAQPMPLGVAAIIAQMAVVCILFDGDGPFQAGAVISNPTELNPLSITLGTVDFKPGQPATLVIQGGMFRVAAFGIHKCVFTVGNKDYTFNFEIIINPSMAATAPISAQSPLVGPAKSAARPKSKRLGHNAIAARIKMSRPKSNRTGKS